MVSTLIAGTFNAFAFAGAGYLFQKLDKSGYSSEMKRHNLAMEKLTKDRDIWNEDRLKEIDRVSNLRYAKQQALYDLSDTNKDLVSYNKQIQEINENFEKTKPQLSSYYKPSEKMKDYTNLVKLGMATPLFYGLLTII